MNPIQMLLSGAVLVGLSTTLPAQEECPMSCEAQAKTECQATKASCCDDAAVVAFKKLEPAKQKAVAQALVRMSGTCPYGSRMSKTIVALDRLYGDSIKSLDGLAKHENCNAELKATLEKELVKLRALKAVNDRAIAAVHTIAAPAMTDCCAEGQAKAEAKSDCGGCGGEKAKDCGGCEGEKAEVAEGGCGGCDDSARVAKLVDGAKTLATSWKSAKADAQKLAPEAQKQLMADMAILKENGVDGVLNSVFAAVIKEAEMSMDACKGLACPKEGILAKHADVMEKCAFTKGICESSVNELRAAYVLLQASTADFRAKKAGKATEAGTCEDAGSCEGAKTDCEVVKVKG